MPKTKQQKQAIVQELEAKLAQARAVIFTSFNALPVKESESLRQKLIKEQGEFWAVKKTLLSRALESLLAAEERPNVKEFDGQVAVVFAYGDQIAPAKVIHDFQKNDETNRLKFLGGLLDNHWLSAYEVEQLANLPSKLELEGRLVGAMQSPITGLVNVLAGNLRGLLITLQQIASSKT
mgnify:CR=1 FL=1